MNSHELTEFLTRCLKAKKYGRSIAHAADYAARIGKIAGSVPSPDGVRNSVDHLIALAQKALRVQAGAAPAVVAEPQQEAKPDAKPKKGKKKAAEAEPEPELEPEPEPEPEPDIPVILPMDD